MADIALTTANKVEIVASYEQLTLVAGEAITAGFGVRIDTTTGKFMIGNATSAGEADIYGVAARTVIAGEALTAIRKGIMDGWNFDGASMTHWDVVHLSNTDGRLADAAGDNARIVGRTVPGTSTTLGTGPDKLLFVDL